jgi:ATP-dependent DNA helicase RecG
MLAPATALASLEWVPRNRLTALTRLGLFTLGDLIAHYPRRHEDRRRFDRFPDVEMDRAVCLLGIVTKTAVKRIDGWRRMVELVIEDESAGVLSQPVTCRWFNMPYIQKMISTGDRMVVFGRPKKRGRQIVIDHPEFEIVEEDADTSIHMNRIVPVHPAGDGVTPRLLRTLIHQALQESDLTAMPSLLPFAKAETLRVIHFPESFAQLESARRALVREEFFSIQLLINARRAEWNGLRGSPKNGKGALLDQLLQSLPFVLTASQREVITEIRHDLARPRRMNRLLQGDVGSGKTLVALAAMLLTVEVGWQAALMAPTQILAEQHYLNFKRLLDPLGIHVALRTASRRESDGATLFGKSEKPQIVVGTHALFYESSEFSELGLVIIDEQHKFGVLQRARLIERGVEGGKGPSPFQPDVLVMTATPIPRTLMQTIYGDLDLSTLREKPANRGEIQTVARETGKLPEVVDFLRKQIDKGRQGYIVYPLVEESEKLAAKSATAEFEKWKPLLAPHEVGLIHGRLEPEEKEAVMARFRDGKLAALVATTVIEVGVDVPNANIMVVENAERFGLAQLHQLRGRIGRGTHKSFCVLLHDPKAEESSREKLAVLEKTSDGFEIAEADLRLRGPGDLLGTAQTGLPPLKLGDLFRDGAIMQEAAALAAEILAADPTLQNPGNVILRESVASSKTRLAAAAG